MTFRYRSRTNGQHLERAKEFETTVIQCYSWVYQPAYVAIQLNRFSFFRDSKAVKHASHI